MESNSDIPEVKLYFNKDKIPVCVNEALEALYSTSSSTSRDSRITDERPGDLLQTFDNLSINSQESLPKLTKFQPPATGTYFEVEVVMAATPTNFVVSDNNVYFYLLMTKGTNT